MNKEVHYEGWLIKSPPTKRIWRARWRRRWFTLKQGEIPEQFCLEYYTDRNCRKLKGVIDLDQCEQVDCGLRLENRKQKFQFMFDIKTPKRTYYLAADTEADMRDWVNCICQVCHLHDTKQAQNEDDNRLQGTEMSAGGQGAGPAVATVLGGGGAVALTNSTNNTTTTTLSNSSVGPSMGSNASGGCGGAADDSSSMASGGGRVALRQQSFSHDNLLRRSIVVEQQPQSAININNNNNSSDCAYVNTEYSNRETLASDVRLPDQRQTTPPLMPTPRSKASLVSGGSPGGGGALYLNTPVVATKQSEAAAAAAAAATPSLSTPSPRMAVNTNGMVRKIPENLVLNSSTLAEMQQQLQQQQQHQDQQSVQPSPALSTASGPYIPISECYSGSPKCLSEVNNPTTPLNNLDPKFYYTPRSHNNIGLNLTNDQSYSPKITNCSLPHSQGARNHRGGGGGVGVGAGVGGSGMGVGGHRSDSDSESVFTDDDEWTHPLPLRENAERQTRPSDSSVENESFVLTYSQRFSKIPDTEKDIKSDDAASVVAAATAAKKIVSGVGGGAGGALDKSSKVLKNKNNLILDFKEAEKCVRDLPQLSDTENTSPAIIGPLDASSVVEESYDIPRSHHLPYYNMGQLFERVISPEANPIAASTPNLLSGGGGGGGGGGTGAYADGGSGGGGPLSSANVRTLPRPHCYTNAAPCKVEGNVFRYDFIEQADLPPVNRKLKPKVNVEDKPPEEVPAKPPTAVASPLTSVDDVALKMAAVNLVAATGPESSPLRPPSVDRKLKPNAFKVGSKSATMVPSSRRSSGVPHSMVIYANENGDNYVMETRTLPRKQRQNAINRAGGGGGAGPPQSAGLAGSGGGGIGGGGGLSSAAIAKASAGLVIQHQRTASANATVRILAPQTQPLKDEHKLQYFDLDVANPPSIIHRQSMSVGNLYATGSGGSGGGVGAKFIGGLSGSGVGCGSGSGSNVGGGVLSANPSARAPVKSSIVYNSVDFIKTEAFKRIREERKKESEAGGGGSGAGGGGGGGSCGGGAPGVGGGSVGGNNSNNGNHNSNNNK